jgi:hypothetical protein
MSFVLSLKGGKSGEKTERANGIKGWRNEVD